MSGKSKHDQDTRIKELLTLMSLSKCQNQPIGDPGLTKTISGGEMKRLSGKIKIKEKLLWSSQYFKQYFHLA